MKSYTDIEQSRKLAEFLPLESADMYIYKNVFFGALSCFNGTTQIGEYTKLTDKESKAYPCWSLAALLNILHSRQRDIPSLSGGGYKDGNYISDWCLDYEYDDGDYQKTFADNPVDACVAMIEELHELNLL